jgi:hypothetical protein
MLRNTPTRSSTPTPSSRSSLLALLPSVLDLVGVFLSIGIDTLHALALGCTLVTTLGSVDVGWAMRLLRDNPMGAGEIYEFRNMKLMAKRLPAITVMIWMKE